MIIFIIILYIYIGIFFTGLFESKNLDFFLPVGMFWPAYILAYPIIVSIEFIYSLGKKVGDRFKNLP